MFSGLRILILFLWLNCNNGQDSPMQSLEMLEFMVELKSKSDSQPRSNYLEEIREGTQDFLETFAIEKLLDQPYELINVTLIIRFSSLNISSSTIKSTFGGFFNFEDGHLPDISFIGEFQRQAFERKDNLLDLVRSSGDVFLSAVEKVNINFTSETQMDEMDTSTWLTKWVVAILAIFGTLACALVSMIIFSIHQKNKIEGKREADSTIPHNPTSSTINSEKSDSPRISLENLSIDKIPDNASSRYTYNGTCLSSICKENDCFDDLSQLSSISHMLKTPALPTFNFDIETYEDDDFGDGVEVSFSKEPTTEKMYFGSNPSTHVYATKRSKKMRSLPQNTNNTPIFYEEQSKVHHESEVDIASQMIRQNRAKWQKSDCKSEISREDFSFLSHDTSLSQSKDCTLFSVQSDVIKDLQRLSNEVDTCE